MSVRTKKTLGDVIIIFPQNNMASVFLVNIGYAHS